MATNELAAILARRRAKDGSPDGMPAVRGAPASATTEAAVPAKPAAPGSIAARIAQLKQQSAAASPVPPPVPVAVPMGQSPAPPNPWVASASQQWGLAATATATAEASSETTTTTTTAETTAEDSGTASTSPNPKRMSSRIQQLQGTLGINVNPFRPGGPPGGYPRPSSGGESIMKTGDQYLQEHGSIHGMGAAIPMPGLAKAGFRLPGMAPPATMEEKQEEASAAAASLEASHATMTRIAGPKRRGPARPPPGAVRIPVFGAMPTATPFDTASSEDQAPAEPVPLFPAPPVEAAPAPATTSVYSTGLFGEANEPTGTSIASPAAPPSAPVAEATILDAGISGLSVAEVSPPKQVAAPLETAPLFAPEPTQPVVPTAAAAGNGTRAPSSRAADPAGLFGQATLDDESSDSGWSSDDKAPKAQPAQPSLFATRAAPTPAVPAVPTPAPKPITPAPIASAPSPARSSVSSLFPAARKPLSESPLGLFGASSTTSSNTSSSSLFAAASSTSTPASSSTTSTSSAQGLASGTTAPLVTGALSTVDFESLFADDDDDNSDDDMVDEGGLFGNGLPTKR